MFKSQVSKKSQQIDKQIIDDLHFVHVFLWKYAQTTRKMKLFKMDMWNVSSSLIDFELLTFENYFEKQIQMKKTFKIASAPLFFYVLNASGSLSAIENRRVFLIWINFEACTFDNVIFLKHRCYIRTVLVNYYLKKKSFSRCFRQSMQSLR